MFAYPKQAEVNRVVSKTKIYAHARPSKRVKELFAAQVDEILWKYKLSPETINLPARNGINEIQIFELALKGPEFDAAILDAVDKAIPFPLVFQLMHDGQVRFAASYKRPSEADSQKWVIEARFQCAPESIDVPRTPLPVALDLASLYEQIVRRHIPLSSRADEGIAEHVARFNALEAKKKTQGLLETQLAKEKQFNRRIELNAQLRVLAAELASLQHL